jgi:hypothetical protein
MRLWRGGQTIMSCTLTSYSIDISLPPFISTSRVSKKNHTNTKVCKIKFLPFLVLTNNFECKEHNTAQGVIKKLNYFLNSPQKAIIAGDFNILKHNKF